MKHVAFRYVKIRLKSQCIRLFSSNIFSVVGKMPGNKREFVDLWMNLQCDVKLCTKLLLELAFLDLQFSDYPK